MELSPLIYGLIGFLGLLIGSFFNVAIHRWPLEDRKEREWVKTPSHCPKCKTPIKWYDNVPVFSWLALRGKCRACQAPISPRYILVEIGTAVLWVLTAWLTVTFGMSGIAPAQITPVHVTFAIIFASLYLLTIIIDAETQLIPDEITITHFVAAWAFFFLARPDVITPGWLSSVIVMLALPAVFFGLFWLGWMGGGDVALAAGFGVLFGWPLGGIVAMLGFVIGGLLMLPKVAILMVQKKFKWGHNEVAFGPFLAISAFICLFFGHALVAWYLAMYGLQLMPDWSVAPLQGWGS